MSELMQSLVGCREGLGFYPEGGGSPGGLWEEAGWDLTQVPLLGRQTMGGEGGRRGETCLGGECADPGEQ